MENLWELYSTSADCEAANINISRAWEQAKRKSSAAEAEACMLKVMKKYAHVGALDSDVRSLLRSRLKAHF